MHYSHDMTFSVVFLFEDAECLRHYTLEMTTSVVFHFEDAEHLQNLVSQTNVHTDTDFYLLQ